MPDSKFQRFSNRFFQVSPLYTAPGWYARLREGSITGPFPSKEAAQVALFNLIGITAETSEGLIVKQAASTQKYSADSRFSSNKHSV